jgi:hypothetical protein
VATITVTANGYARYQELRGDLTMFTEPERRAIQILVEAWTAFVCLPSEHPSDIDEFRDAIHRAQLLIMARPGRRAINAEKQNVSERYITKLDEEI